VWCEFLEEFRPAVVSFHFGLPDRDLVARVKATGARILSSATTVGEAIWLQDHGCDAIIAQGLEAGGHRGMFLSDNINSQLGTLALLPMVADAVTTPVIATGGIADARGIVAAVALGASAVQLGTAYQFCREAKITKPYRSALRNSRDRQTAVTNVSRAANPRHREPARPRGRPISALAPEFRLAAGAIAPLRAKAESLEAASLGRELPAADPATRV
jgi:nitronate monooxygenase